MSRSGPARTIALLSPCGWGNLGDAAIIESLIEGVRRRAPGTRLIAFTLGPADTSGRHGIEAYPCVGHASPFYLVNPVGTAAAQPAIAGRGRGSRAGAVRRVAIGIVSLVRRLPIRGSARVWLVLPFRLFAARAHWTATRERLRGVSQVVVAGGGQLDDVWGGAFGHPYVLWWFARLSRQVGARYVVASVGTGSLSSLSRAIVIRALRQAAYRSYRDERSRELLRAPALTRADPIVPDLAYAVTAWVVPPPSGDKLVIGLNPMHFARPGAWPQADEARYRAHVAVFGRLAARLVDSGREVVFFSTSNDERALDDAYEIAARAAPAHREHLSIARTAGVDAVFAVFGRLDAVVASRLHGVLLAHVAHRPVLAVAHERKVRSLMEEMGQGRYCVDIDEFDPDQGMIRLEALLAERTALAADIASRVAEYRRRIFAQYDTLFGPDRTGVVGA